MDQEFRRPKVFNMGREAAVWRGEPAGTGEGTQYFSKPWLVNGKPVLS